MKKIILIFILFITSINAKNNEFTIEDCREQILPTKINDQLLEEIFNLYNENNFFPNCKEVYLNILLSEKVTKIREAEEKKLQEMSINKQIIPPQNLDIQYTNKDTETVKYFNYTDNFEGINIEKLSPPDHKDYLVSRFPLNVNNKMFVELGAYYFSEFLNSDFESKRHHIKDEKEENQSFLKDFPIKNLELEFPKGKFQTLSLNMIEIEKNSIYYSFINHSGEQKRSGTWQSVNILIDINEEYHSSYITLKLEEGQIFLKSENENGILYYIEEVKK